jgi:LacI family transcriptional regulator
VRVSPGKKNGHQYSVVTNDRELAAEMTRFLASLGHEKIAFITGHPEHKAVGNRFSGYKDGLQQSGLEFSATLVAAGDNSIRSGEACAAALLQSEDPPTAIFAANDDMAAGVIRVADRLGIKVPEQLSVAGCDDIALAQQIYPALTTINQPLAAMADEAVMLLIDSARQKEKAQEYAVVPGTLKIRESTGPAPKN